MKYGGWGEPPGSTGANHYQGEGGCYEKADLESWGISCGTSGNVNRRGSKQPGRDSCGHPIYTFTVANHSFPPGRYAVTAVNQTLLGIFNSHNQGTIVLAHSTDGVAPEETGKLVFHRYGGAYFLSEVWDPASQSGHKVFESRVEAELTRKQTAMEIAVLQTRR